MDPENSSPFLTYIIAIFGDPKRMESNKHQKWYVAMLEEMQEKTRHVIWFFPPRKWLVVANRYIL
jgi:hypothetical protein